MRVLINKASDLDYEEVREFKDWNELFAYLRKQYSSWIVELDKKKIVYNLFAKESEWVDVEVTMYDDYVE